MHRNKGLRFLLVVVTSAGLALPSQMVSAETPLGQPVQPSAAPPVVRQPGNVELQSGGVLTGQIIDGHGVGMGATRVVLHNGAAKFAEATTDANGIFQMPAVRGGVYQLSAADMSLPVRVWANQTAPPGSAQAVMLTKTDVVAGQYSPMKYWLADPLVIGGIVLIAAGVPIILANQNNDSGS